MRSYFSTITAIFFAIIFLAGFSFLSFSKFAYYSAGFREIFIADGAYYLAFAKAYWFEGVKTIYLPESHIKILSSLFNQPINQAMPLGISPVAMLVFLPFAALSLKSIETGVSAWNAFQLVLFLVVLVTLYLNVFSSRSARYRVLFVLIFLLTLTTAAIIDAIRLGQTSLLATSLFLYLLYELYLAQEKKREIRTWVVVTVGLVLAIKPTYFLFFVGLLAVNKLWRLLTISIVVSGLVAFAVGLPMGINWPLDYFASLSVFTSPNPPAIYGNAFSFTNQILFRNVFSGLFGDKLVLILSQLLPLMFFLLFTLLGLRSKETGWLKYFVGIVGAYYLFTPYVGAYEGLLIVSLVIGSLLFNKDLSVFSISLYVLSFLMLYSVLDRVVFFPVNILWVFELVCFVVLVLTLSEGTKKTERLPA